MTDEQPDNAANPSKVRERGRKEKLATRQDNEDLQQLLATPRGRRVLARVMFDICHLRDTSFNPSGQLFAANEGRRTVGIELEQLLIDADLDGYLALLREHEVKRRM